MKLLPAISSAQRTAGIALRSAPTPTITTVISTRNPPATPDICGRVRRSPKVMPEDSSIRLLGPGVMAAIKE